MMHHRLAPLTGGFVGLALISGLIGCGPKASDRADFTVTMHVETPPDQRVLYRTTKDGAIEFAGGSDAIFETPSWTGDLTDAELAELTSILRGTDYFNPRPSSGDDAADDAATYRVSIVAPNGRRRFTVKGGTDAVRAVERVLDQAAQRRLDVYLNRQPRAAPPSSDS